MAEKFNNGRTIKEIITDATDRQLDEYSEKTLSPEELMSMAAGRAGKKRDRILKMTAVAALFIVAVVGAVMVFNGLTVDVGANKNEKEEIVTEDGIIIEDEGWGSSVENIKVANDWDEVLLIKEDAEKLIIPKYIPAGYRFKELTIENLEGESTVNKFQFINSKGEQLILHQFIHSNNLEMFAIEDIQIEIDSSKGKIYIKEIDNNKIAAIQFDDGISIEIWAPVTNSEILKIVENLK